MKKLTLVALLFVGCNEIEQKTYCGRIVNKFQTEAGYKVQPQKHIVIFNKELNRNVDVQVTWNCYVNAQIDSFICFELTKYDLKN